jgi:2-isopropylmalate synthase
MLDLARQSARSGRLVIWEEAARDGAQGKTLMTAVQRIALARATGGLFGAHGPHHVIFAAGFPSICGEEFEIVRQLADEVDDCTLASHGRATREDIELGLRALAGAAHARVTFFIPVSPRMSHVLGLGTPAVALRKGLDMLAFALDRAGGVPVDVTLAMVTQADPQFVADAVAQLTHAGAAIVKLCDTVGEFYPRQCRRYFEEVFARLGDDEVVGAHLHNDFGFALTNNLEAVGAGVRVVGSSWLGIGERNGLAPTEQMLFALGHAPETLPERLEIPAEIWRTPPALRGLVPIARTVSAWTGVPLRVTDAIVGTGVNSISTGTPFHAPSVFQPFDPEEVLGVPLEVQLTHLANRQVINAVAAERGVELSAHQAAAAMRWVKTEAYRRGHAVISKSEFFAYLEDELMKRGDHA